jgi:sugar phosphate isomerase/epimerase
MKKILIFLFALTVCMPGLSQQLIKSWDGIQDKSISELEQDYALPPAEYASHILWGWEGAMNAQIMKNDLDLMQRVGTRVINIEPGYDFPYEYLSDGWFKMVKMAVKEAKERGMKVWLIDDAKYPSGFAGGKFSRERPDMKMWGGIFRPGSPQGSRFGHSHL